MIGEPITMSDCSEKSFSNELRLSNEARFSDITEQRYTFYDAGTYTAELKAFSKKGNKTETAIQSVSVSAPAFAEIEGVWRLSKVNTHEELNIDPNVDLFDLPIVKQEEFEELITIKGNEMLITHISDNYFIFENALPLSYSNGVITAGNTTFKVVRLTGNSMIWRAFYFKGFKMVYLSKES